MYECRPRPFLCNLLASNPMKAHTTKVLSRCNGRSRCLCLDPTVFSWFLAQVCCVVHAMSRRQWHAILGEQWHAILGEQAPVAFMALTLLLEHVFWAN